MEYRSGGVRAVTAASASRALVAATAVAGIICPAENNRVDSAAWYSVYVFNGRGPDVGRWTSEKEKWRAMMIKSRVQTRKTYIYIKGI